MRKIVKPQTRNFALSDAETHTLKEWLSRTAIELVSVAELVPYAKNVKDHPQHQVELVAESIRKFGFNQPILIDSGNVIIAGHARLEAAKLLKLTAVPAIRLAHLNEPQKRALRIADNKLAELGSWHIDHLTQELRDLTSPDLELDFDVLTLGFETVEIDQLLEENRKDNRPDPADELPEIAPDAPATTETGDIWVCDDHQLYCGDAQRTSSYEALLLGRTPAQLVFTDPPYNVPNQGHVTKRTSVREFVDASGELTPAEYSDFLGRTATCIRNHVAPGAVIYMCMDWRHSDELSFGTRNILGRPKNMIVWVKTNAGLGTFYRSQHELIYVYVIDGGRAINNFKLGARGRHRTNVWRYPGMNSFGRQRDTLLGLHPTVKPVALVSDALLDCSNRNDIVLDPFAGSGTTMIAAERIGRKARLIEIDPLYCDVIVGRWQHFSGKAARLASSNETFAEVGVRRSMERDGRGQ